MSVQSLQTKSTRLLREKYKHLSAIIKAWKVRRALIKTHPDMFGLRSFRAWKIGIQDDLFARYPEDSRHTIQLALELLRGSKRIDDRVFYYRVLAKGGHRFDLDGNPCGEISAEEQTHALLELQKAKESARRQREAQRRSA
ncbi:MAG: hypothetical protein HQL80_07160 [Magnetococcales bacterium]|nr:hypothetical protein [Magnetococcales bacterium]